jgi:A/G-specific adenine glycosylase
MKSTPVGPDSRAALRAELLAHYDGEARDLPWRADTDPYRILVSEVMLQQTRVETVERYYGRWLDRFPTLDSLASAGEDAVLKIWEGLGYYRRARNLHRAARVVREEHDGTIPRTVQGLLSLPGVGEYTAGAVASIAFGVPVPAVDGNVRRVLARLFDVPAPTPVWLRARGQELVDPDRPGDWNQALMELGATICTPRSPRCGRCPVAKWCGAREAGTQADRPAPPRKRPVPTCEIALAVIHEGGRLLLEKRPPEGLLAGMWAFPERLLPAAPGTSGEQVITETPAPRDLADGPCGAARAGDGRAEALAVVAALGLAAVGEPQALTACRHRFTHLEVLYLPWAVAVGTGDVVGSREVAWVEAAARGNRAMPRAQQRVLDSWMRTNGVHTK